MDNWAIVELYRNQHGKLPGGSDDLPLDFSEAFHAAAEKVSKGELDTFNAASLLHAAGDICNSVNFVKGQTPISGKCFACQSGEAKYSVQIQDKDEGETFSRSWCYDCLKSIFKELRKKEQ